MNPAPPQGGEVLSTFMIFLLFIIVLLLFAFLVGFEVGFWKDRRPELVDADCFLEDVEEDEPVGAPTGEDDERERRIGFEY